VKALLIDGYNIIHAHPRLSDVMGHDPDAAREGLLREVSPLASPGRYDLVLLVFDAAGSHQPEPVTEERGGITVAFTRRGQSADDFIEAVVGRMAPASDIEVATSDRVLISVVTGFGARVLKGNALLDLAADAASETRQEIERLSGRGRAPLEDRVSEEIRRLLDEMRYG
jgi:predicted RNA-binding protein with PIN domain